MMNVNHTFWPDWAHFLRRSGLAETAAALLEGAGPLSVLLAQLVYAGQPLFDHERCGALAHLFEDPEEGQRFAAFLRQEETE